MGRTVTLPQERYEEMLDEIIRMREALWLCDPNGDRMTHIHAPEDPVIKALCERLGYGAVIDSAARQWREKDPKGAFTAGPCVSTVRQALGLDKHPQPTKGAGMAGGRLVRIDGPRSQTSSKAKGQED